MGISFFESQPMFVCDQLTLKILCANEAAVSKLGYNLKELVGRPLTLLGKQIVLTEDQVEDSTIISNETWEIKTKDKQLLYFQYSSHLIKHLGQPAKVVVAHDITDIIREKEVNKVPFSYPIGFHDFPLAELEWDMSLKILRWSKKSSELFGYTQEEILHNQYVLKDILKPDFELLVKSIEKDSTYSNRNTRTIRLRNRNKHGDIVECEWYNSYLHDKNGKISSIYSVIKDVTVVRAALRKYEQTMGSFRDLYNSISDAIYLLNFEGTIIDANTGTEEVFGYSRSEMLGQDIRFLGAGGKFSEEKVRKYLIRAQKGESIKYEGWGKKKNGEVFPTEVLINAGSFLDEEVLIVVERDISERLLSHEVLKHRESLFSNLFHSSPIGIALLNNHHEIDRINDSFANIFGYKEEEIKGLELDKLIVPDDGIDDATELSNSKTAKVYTGKRKTKDGSIIDVIVCAVPVIVDNRVIAVYGIYVDITDRKDAEEKLKRNLREKEVLLAEIHHRVKNNLAVITGLLELQSLTVDNSSAQTVLKDSQMRVNSIAMVHELLYQSEDFSQVSIQNYLRELSKVISLSLMNRTVPIDIAFDLDEVELEITQAIPCGLLLNEILTNSYKHAFQGKNEGQIWVSFKKVGEDLVYSIRDNGIGLPSNEEEKKRKSLGMTLIRTLGKQLHAETEIRSENGVLFEFRFKKKVIQPRVEV
ncbi:PAS domain S-box protein [Balneola vulgaris]|uniref:PAS domain S-box protein n=1 Tax=Balneola vulgaris TaxID=287535 RepID=UPI000376FF7F|nr:PAS domain S-box protein [Balneola vulgaris]